jgi:hypothetical protein
MTKFGGARRHWSEPQRQRAADAVLDAREAAKLAELESEFDRKPGDTSDLPPWSQVSPGVPVVTRQAELDQLEGDETD